MLALASGGAMLPPSVQEYARQDDHDGNNYTEQGHQQHLHRRHVQMLLHLLASGRRANFVIGCHFFFASVTKISHKAAALPAIGRPFVTRTAIATAQLVAVVDIDLALSPVEAWGDSGIPHG